MLAGIPVLLHLIMRQKPKTLPFPAFRFLVQNTAPNLRKLRLRHLLLLALRMLLVAAMVLALARPQLFSEASAFSSERPVAAVLVFDTSASMDYRSSDGVSRLDEAKKRGQELLDELPQGSRVAVLDSADTTTSAKDPWESLADAAQAHRGVESAAGQRPRHSRGTQWSASPVRAGQAEGGVEDRALRPAAVRLLRPHPRLVGR